MRHLRAQRHRKLCRVQNLMRAKSLTGVAAVEHLLANPADAAMLEDAVAANLVGVRHDVLKAKMEKQNAEG